MLQPQKFKFMLQTNERVMHPHYFKTVMPDKKNIKQSRGLLKLLVKPIICLHQNRFPGQYV